jgi:uncharacterized protein (DUF2141 family)
MAVKYACLAVVLGVAMQPADSQVRASDSQAAAGSHKITLHVRGLKSSEGKILAGLYNREDGFPTNRDGWVKGESSYDIVSGRATVTFTDMPPGTYAIAVFHDENDNNDLDTNWIGIPKEGVGASNDALGRLGPPKWTDAKFEVDGNVRTTAKMKYY